MRHNAHSCDDCVTQSLVSVHHVRHGAVLLSWIASFAVVTSVTIVMKQQFSISKSAKLDAAMYSIVVCMACETGDFDYYPISVASVDVISSLLCRFIYVLDWRTWEKNELTLGESGSLEMKDLQIHLGIISVKSYLLLVCLYLVAVYPC